MSAHDHAAVHDARPVACTFSSCFSAALPLARARTAIKSATKAGRGGGSRTPSLRFWRPTLYQLSYTPRAWPTARERLHTLVRQACHIFFLTSCRLWGWHSKRSPGAAFCCVFLEVYRSPLQRPG